MARTKLDNFGFTVKENGKIDFDRPPKGKIFVPVPTDEEEIKSRHIDRRFVVFHTFSATTMLCVMELLDETEAEKAKTYIAGIKADCKRKERERRCRFVNPETGREIMCPECISCYSNDCPKKRGIQVWTNIPAAIEDMAEAVKNSVYDDDPTASEAIVNVMWDDFKGKLSGEKTDLVKIIEWDEYGYSSKEILGKLKKKETDTSWYSYQWQRIRRHWNDFYNG